MNSARLKLEIRAVFWREGDVWRGEALELDATGEARVLKDAISKLLTSAYRKAGEEFAAGQLPGRPMSAVPDHIRGRWHRLYETQGRGALPLSKVYAGEGNYTEVALSFTIDVARKFDELPMELPELKVVLFQQDGWWIAQALERDLGAEGRTLDEARSRFDEAVFAQALTDAALGLNPFAQLDPAPREFWELYEHARALEDRVRIAAA